jgi:hypothetical protein
VELALILPLAVLLICSAYVVNKELGNQERVRLLSREVSLAALRNCSDSVYSTNNAVERCLNDVAFTARQQARQLLSDFRLIVSVYSYSGAAPGQGTIRLRSIVQTESPDASSAVHRDSQFSADSIAVQFRAALDVQGSLFVAEFYANQPSPLGFPSFLTYLSGKNYAATMS